MFLKFGDKTKKVSVGAVDDEKEKVSIDGEEISTKDAVSGKIKKAVDFFTQKNQSTNNKK